MSHPIYRSPPTVIMSKQTPQTQAQQRSAHQEILKVVKQPFPICNKPVKSTTKTYAQASPTLAPDADQKDEMLEMMRESVSVNLECAYLDFRDTVQDAFYCIKDYLSARGAPVLDRCHFGQFMEFCEQVAEIPQNIDDLRTDCYNRYHTDLNDEIDILDPY